MEASQLEEWLVNANSVDFQIVPLDLTQAGGESNKLCILTEGSTSLKYAIFDVEGNSIHLAQQGETSPEEILNDHLDIETEPSSEAINRIATFEDYIKLYPCKLGMRFDASNKQFYIHPKDKNGTTMTFELEGNQVTLLPLSPEDTSNNITTAEEFINN